MNVTSNDAATSAYYAHLTELVYSIGGIVCPVLGGIGAVLGSIVFSQKSMRENPASIYFIAFHIINFLYLLYAQLQLGVRSILYHSLALNNNLVNCKIYNFSTYVLAGASRYCLVLASIDRTLVTSSNALMRRRSTPRLAYRMISAMILVLAIFYSHTIVGFNLRQVGADIFYCIPWAGVYSYFTTFSVFVVNAVIPLLLMVIFAAKTLRNLRRIGIQPANTVVTTMTTKQLRDRQLTILLLVEIVAYCSLVPWGASFNIYVQSTQSVQKSVQRQGVETFVLAATGFLSYLPATVSFYQSLLVSKAFRRKAMQVLFNRCQQHPIDDDSVRSAGKITANRSNVQ